VSTVHVHVRGLRESILNNLVRSYKKNRQALQKHPIASYHTAGFGTF
jgi:hypothetical protein